MRRLIISLMAGAIAIALGSGQAFAQSTLGSIQGTIVDQSGASLPGVTVTIRNTGTGSLRTAVTNSSGNYNVTLLPPGNYTASAALQGFATLEKTGITLQVSQNARIDFQLKVSKLKEAVQVTAQAPLVDSADTSTKVVVTTKKIVGLPLNGRNFVDLGLTVPGVQPISEGSNVASRGGGMNIDGMPETNNNYIVDGFDNNDPTTGEIQTFPSVDAIQEFTIMGASYPADAGFASGGIVSLVTKSGTSQFHGDGFEFFRNSRMDARNFFATSNPPLNRNQYGGTLGGPLPFKHMFFFGSYEGTRDNEGITTTSTVPTPAMKAGNFSALSTPIINPSTGQPFPGNVIPSNMINPIGAAMLQQLYPDPNASGSVRNYIISPTVANDLRQIDARVDYQPSGSNRVFARYEMYWNTQGEALGASFPVAFQTVAKHNQNIGFEWTHIFTPNVLQEARFSYGHIYNGIWAANQQNWDKMLGITGAQSSRYSGFLNLGPPTISLTGYSPVNGRTSPFLRIHHIWEVDYALTQIHGNHAFKYGMTYRKYSMKLTYANTTQGRFAFTGQYTGNSVADMLLGYPAQTRNASGPENTTELSWQAAVYAEDSWRATHRVTVNYGLRWEYQAPDIEANNNWGTFVPSLVQMVRVGTNGVLPSIRKAYYKDFGPRAGVAWDISKNGDGRRVVRGSYGIYYESLLHNIFYSSFLYPPISSFGIFTASRTTPNISLNDPFPSSLGVGINSGQGVNPNYHGGRTQRWMLDFQQAIGGNGVIDVGYIGSIEHGLGVRYNLNQPTPGPGSLSARRPYPTFSSINWTNPSGFIRYNALQTKYQQRLHGLSLMVSYTLSRTTANTLDNASNQDPLNQAADTGPAAWDRTHVLVVSGTWDSPFHSMFAKDWQLGLIWTIESGTPVTPTLSLDVANVGSFNQRPNVSGNPNNGPKSINEWFNTKAYSLPAPYTYGNAGVNSIRGPGVNTANLALSRIFPMGGSRSLELRFEAFNLFNHNNFLNPNADFNSPEFGYITAAGPAREIQLGVKFRF